MRCQVEAADTQGRTLRYRCHRKVGAFFIPRFQSATTFHFQYGRQASRLATDTWESDSDMSDSKPTYLTEEGLKKLKEELHFLKTKERARVAQAIADARAQGDLSENAEYDAAKDEQGLLEAKIAKLETAVSSARIVDESQIDSSKAYILSNVKVKNTANGMEQTYTLVSAQEADFATGKISVKSPIGEGLLGKSVGDKVDIQVPAGKVTLEILDISRG